MKYRTVQGQCSPAQFKSNTIRLRQSTVRYSTDSHNVYFSPGVLDQLVHCLHIHSVPPFALWSDPFRTPALGCGPVWVCSMRFTCCENIQIQSNLLNELGMITIVIAVQEGMLMTRWSRMRIDEITHPGCVLREPLLKGDWRLRDS
jgi:hypothetical protein